MDRQSVRGVARPRQNAGCHLADDGELSSGCFPEQRNHQVFEGDHTNLKLDEFRIGQRRNARMYIGRDEAWGKSAGARAAFVIPPLKGRPAQRGAIQPIGLPFVHGELPDISKCDYRRYSAAVVPAAPDAARRTNHGRSGLIMS